MTEKQYQVTRFKRKAFGGIFAGIFISIFVSSLFTSLNLRGWQFFLSIPIWVAMWIFCFWIIELEVNNWLKNDMKIYKIKKSQKVE